MLLKYAVDKTQNFTNVRPERKNCPFWVENRINWAI